MSSRFEFDGTRTGVLAANAVEGNALGEMAFHRMIAIERRRTTRSRKAFLLMLLDMGDQTASNPRRPNLRKILSTLSSMLRETDVTGWYKEPSVVGVMFTEITLDDQGSVPATMMNRVSQALQSQLAPQQFHQIGISFHLHPESQNPESQNEEISSPDAYPMVYARAASGEENAKSA